MEATVDSVTSAVNAARGGASRIELCSALGEGGLTPSVGLLKVVKSLVVDIPVFVMIRPRRGTDFAYTEDEIKVMKKDVSVLKDAGADGFVFGVLTPDGDVNELVCEELLQLCRPLPVTFHRAFDVTRDPVQSLEIIIKLGFTRILTSGQSLSADSGVSLLAKLIEIANNRIIIVPGAGINEKNLAHILKGTQAKEFHASARSKISFSRNAKTCPMGASDTDADLLVTDSDMVRKLVDISNDVWKAV